MKYSKEQVDDITKRVNTAISLLKEMDLEIGAQIGFENTGNDVFGIKLLPYLKDVRYKENIPDVSAPPTPKVTDVETTPKS